MDNRSLKSGLDTDVLFIVALHLSAVRSNPLASWAHGTDTTGTN
ncbi:TPA: hypothetical protein ACVBYD_000662 [Yersinia enterocolitica]